MNDLVTDTAISFRVTGLREILVSDLSEKVASINRAVAEKKRLRYTGRIPVLLDALLEILYVCIRLYRAQTQIHDRTPDGEMIQALPRCILNP